MTTNIAQFEVVKESLNRAERINMNHRKFGEGLRTALQFAVAAGEDLVDQKVECGHGNWISWIETNLEFSHSTAKQYMRCYRKWANGRLPADLTLEDAARVRNKPSKEEIDEVQKLENKIKADLKKLEAVAKERAAKLYVEQQKLKKEQEKLKKSIEFPEIDLDVEFEDVPVLEAINEEEELRKQTVQEIEMIKESEQNQLKLLRNTEKDRAEIVRNAWEVLADGSLSHLNQKLLAEAMVKYLQKRYKL